MVCIMEREHQITLARKFSRMHTDERMFILPNAWDGGSATVFEREGFQAIGTTSAGIAYSMGYPDGEKIAFADLLRVTGQIIDVINVPLSVDIERGYGSTIDDIKENVRKVIEAGAVGINIEDGHPGESPYLEELGRQVQIIRAIAELKQEMNIPFVINARTCVYLLPVCDVDQRGRNCCPGQCYCNPIVQ